MVIGSARVRATPQDLSPRHVPKTRHWLFAVPPELAKLDTTREHMLPKRSKVSW